MFEQELYNNFSINSSRSYFISFAGDVSMISRRLKAFGPHVDSVLKKRLISLYSLYLQNCQVGLNFASEEEAKRFRAALNDLLGRRQRKTGNYSGSVCSVYTTSAFSPPQPFTFWTEEGEEASISLPALLLTRPQGPIPNRSLYYLRPIL